MLALCPESLSGCGCEGVENPTPYQDLISGFTDEKGRLRWGVQVPTGSKSGDFRTKPRSVKERKARGFEFDVQHGLHFLGIK